MLHQKQNESNESRTEKLYSETATLRTAVRFRNKAVLPREDIYIFGSDKQKTPEISTELLVPSFVECSRTGNRWQHTIDALHLQAQFWFLFFSIWRKGKKVTIWVIKI